MVQTIGLQRYSANLSLWQITDILYMSIYIYVHVNIIKLYNQELLKKYFALEVKPT